MRVIQLYLYSYIEDIYIIMNVPLVDQRSFVPACPPRLAQSLVPSQRPRTLGTLV